MGYGSGSSPKPAGKKPAGKKPARAMTAKEKEAVGNLRKIMTSKTGAIKTGTLAGKGAKSTAKEVDKEVPTGYVVVVRASDRKFKRMPRKAFTQALVGANVPAKTKENMLRKAQSKDREVFTNNKKVLKEVGL
tara:strand:- start:2223 stop:2621 length:399 start_codon:yes stop_codon:yes gene_type:complete